MAAAGFICHARIRHKRGNERHSYMCIGDAPIADSQKQYTHSDVAFHRAL
jgi:hypothetical protein